jgi:hypothetical protein
VIERIITRRKKMVRRTTSPQWGYSLREDQWEKILIEFPEREKSGVYQLLRDFFSTLVDEEKGLKFQANTLPEIKVPVKSVNQMELLRRERRRCGKALNMALKMAHLLDVWVILEVQSDGVLLKLQPFNFNPA